MKKVYLSPEEVIVNLNASCAIAETSNMSIDTETVVSGEINDNDKLVKESVWDKEW